MIPKEIQRAVVREYEDGVPPKELIKKYGLVSKTCYNIIKRGTDVKINHARRKYHVKKDYFDVIDTEYKAYFLGLICADGCIYKSVLDVALQAGDEYILESLADDIFLVKGRPLRFVKPKEESHVGCYRLYVSSLEITNALREIGLHERKTYDMRYPFGFIPDNLFGYFLRGIFDGDGSIYRCSQKGRLHFSISGNYEFLESLKNEISRITDIQIPNKIHRRKNSNGCEIQWSAKKLLTSLYHLMYDDATIYLIRKKDKFKQEGIV